MRKILGGFVLVLGLGAARDAAAICREVHEPDSPPPVIEPVQAVLIAKRTGVVIGESCPPPAEDTDAGVPPDAGPCEPTYGDVVSMVVQPRFAIGPEGSSFALLMVTPAPPVIAIEDHALFAQLAEATAPEVVVEQVEIEDTALGYQCCDPHYGGSPSVCGSSYGGSYSGGGGCGLGGGGDYSGDDDSYGSLDASFTPPPMDGGVAIETIGAYEVVRVSSTDRAELAGWLDTYGYVYTQADLDAVEPYMADGWTVIAVRVAATAAIDGGLEPLSFTWSRTSVPLGISRQPSLIHYPLTVYLEAETRYELGGGRVAYARRVQGPAGASTAFLTRLEVDVDPWAEASADPVAAPVIEIEQQDVVTVEQEVHIPSSQCPYSSSPPPRDDRYGCCDAGGRQANVVLLGIAVVLGMPRRRRRRH